MALFLHTVDVWSARVHQLGLGYGVLFHCVYESAHTESLSSMYTITHSEPDNITLSNTFIPNGASYVHVWAHAGEGVNDCFICHDYDLTL